MALACVLVSGCINDAAVVGECVPDGPARRVLMGPSVADVGLLEGRTLISWSEPTDRVSTDGQPERLWRAAWLTPDGSVESERVLGFRRGFGSNHWVREGASLVTQSSLSTTDEPVPFRVEDGVHLVRVGLDGSVRVEHVELPVTLARSPDCELCSVAGWGASSLQAGADFLYPMVATSHGAVAAIQGIPAGCGSYFASAEEPILFGGIDAIVATRIPCEMPPQRAPVHLGLIARESGVGILHRVGYSGDLGVVHYLAVDAGGGIVVSQASVGATEFTSSSDSGYDLHGVTLGEDGVLFRELSAGNHQDMHQLCYRLRTFEADGTGAHDTPFQLACMRSDRITRSARLLALDGGYAAIAWAERPRVARDGFGDGLVQITTSTPWDEGIYLAMIAPDGRRASEIVRVTTDESTIMGAALDRRTETSGPFPGDMTVSATSEGNRVALAWRDERVDAPGIYVRTYTCERFAE